MENESREYTIIFDLFLVLQVVWLHLYGMNGHETVMKNGGKEDG